MPDDLAPTPSSDAPPRVDGTEPTPATGGDLGVPCGDTPDPRSIDGVIAARIERLKAMLAAGTYQIDLDALASRITDDELARTGRR